MAHDIVFDFGFFEHVYLKWLFAFGILYERVGGGPANGDSHLLIAIIIDLDEIN